jgi:hypothetical protein
MKDQNFGKPSVVILLIASILGRLLPHPANFTPLGGAALFGGAKIGRPWNYLGPLFVLFITDLVIGLHGTMAYVYAGFVLTVFMGEQVLKGKPSLVKVGVTGLAGSLVFFIVSNFGVWAEGLMYPKTLTGLIDCYIAAIPFFRNSLIGDAVFSVGFFGLYQLAENRGLAAQFDKTVISWLGNK